MREHFQSVTENAETLGEVFDRVMGVFRVFDPEGHSKRFWYISGVITSHGNIGENLARMARRTEMIKALCGNVVFAPTCVFSGALVHRLQAQHQYRQEDWMAFWARVLCSGYVGAVVVTPGWERSRGADIEYAIARNLGLAIYYYDDSVLCARE